MFFSNTVILGLVFDSMVTARYSLGPRAWHVCTVALVFFSVKLKNLLKTTELAYNFLIPSPTHLFRLLPLEYLSPYNLLRPPPPETGSGH